MGLKYAIAAAAIAAFAPSFAATAATIDPAAFDLVLTESKRTTSVDGVDLTGSAWADGNRDIKTFDIGGLDVGDDVLLVGRVGSPYDDVFFTSVSGGAINIEVINFVQFAGTATPESAFGASFQLSVNGALVQQLDLNGVGDELIENQSLVPVLAAGDQVTLRILGLLGVSDYDVGISISAGAGGVGGDLGSIVAAVPLPATLPATLPLMFGGAAIFGFGLLGRRRARA